MPALYKTNRRAELIQGASSMWPRERVLSLSLALALWGVASARGEACYQRKMRCLSDQKADFFCRCCSRPLPHSWPTDPHKTLLLPRCFVHNKASFKKSRIKPGLSSLHSPCVHACSSMGSESRAPWRGQPGHTAGCMGSSRRCVGCGVGIASRPASPAPPAPQCPPHSWCQQRGHSRRQQRLAGCHTSGGTSCRQAATAAAAVGRLPQGLYKQRSPAIPAVAAVASSVSPGPTQVTARSTAAAVAKAAHRCQAVAACPAMCAQTFLLSLVDAALCSHPCSPPPPPPSPSPPPPRPPHPPLPACSCEQTSDRAFDASLLGERAEKGGGRGAEAGLAWAAWWPVQVGKRSTRSALDRTRSARPALLVGPRRARSHPGTAEHHPGQRQEQTACANSALPPPPSRG